MEDEGNEGLTPGTLFGQYRIERKLGAGAMGAVYAATHTGLNKPVVVKVLLPHHAQSRAVRQRFVREGEAAARIRHANIVDVTDVGMHEQTPYLVMERLEGMSLGAMLEQNGALPVERAVDLMLPVIAAVEAAHAVGVVHRDLKPENLFVTRTPKGTLHPKVLDFGISRVISEEAARQTGTAAVLGTPAYMSPEQITCSRDADALSDQYSLGVILYECFTGRRAFSGGNIYTILRKVGAGTFAPPRSLRPELPVEIEQIVLRAMAHDANARFGSLSELSAALIPFASERGRILWGEEARPIQMRGAPKAPPNAGDATPQEKPDSLVSASGPSREAAEKKPHRGRIAWLAIAVILLSSVCVGALGARAFSDRNATTAAPSPPAMVREVDKTHLPVTEPRLIAVSAHENAQDPAALPTEAPTEQIPPERQSRTAASLPQTHVQFDGGTFVRARPRGQLPSHPHAVRAPTDDVVFIP